GIRLSGRWWPCGHGHRIFDPNASTILLAVPVIIGRFFVVQSPLWLAYRGRVEEAEVATARLLRRDPPYPKEVVLRAPVGAAIAHAQAHEHAPWSALFAGVHLRRTILLGALV